MCTYTDIYIYINACMTVCSENATPTKSSESRNSNHLVKIQFKQKSGSEILPRCTAKSRISIWRSSTSTGNCLVYLYIRVYTYTYIHKQMNTHTHKYIHIYTQKYTHIHTHMHVCIYKYKEI